MGKSTTRPHEIHLRLNEEEYQALEANRKKCNLPQQTYLRKLCHGIRPKEFPPAEYWEVHKLLRQMNLTLTGIALKVCRENPLDHEFIWECMNSVESAICKLINELYRGEEEFDGEHLQ